MGRTALVGEELEAVAHVQPLIGDVFGRGGERVFRGNLAQRGGLRIAIEQGAHVFQQAEVFRPGVVVDVVLEGVGIVGAEPASGAQFGGLGRVVAQERVVVGEVDRVEAEAVDAAVQPELQVVQLHRVYVRVVEVELGLR